MRFFFISLILWINPSILFSQEFEKPDTAAFFPDTSIVDTVKATKDTLGTVTGIDTVVNYSCSDSIVYFFRSKTMSLYSKGNIKHQQMELQSERIDINWNTSVMNARGVIDTSDTTQKIFCGTPIMKDGGDEYKGKELSYNFQTKKGKINVGDTQQDQGFYHGEEIKKVDKDIMFICDGRYTTCDKDTPHYHFFSPKMKVTMQDKVIAEPVYMYIANVPVFGLPFAVFPNKGGRRSGIIPPAIVEDATHGRLLHHLGYYWAISDYTDVNFMTDLYTKGSWVAYSDFRYALRYHFYGSVNGQYRKMMTGEKNDPSKTKEESYRLSILHNQEINPTTRFNVNFTFASQNSFRNTLDLRQALDQSIISNATLSKSWEGTPNSISLNLSRRQNLIDGSIDETLPAISFNHSQSYPFRWGKSSAGTENMSWYEMIGINYNVYASNSRSKIKRKISGIKMQDSTIQTVEDFERSRTYSLNQGLGFGIAPKLGHFTISPSLSYSDQRSFTNKDIPYRTQPDSSFAFRNEKLTRRNGTVTSGVSIGTKLYGIVQPEVLGISALRHTVVPNLSLSYQKQIIGDNILPKRMWASFGLSNVFEMKTIPKKEDEEPDKIQLLNLNGEISYDFSADSMNFSPIRVSYRTGIGEVLDVSGGASFDLYKLDYLGNDVYNRVNKYLISEEGRLARMTDFSINISTSLSGEGKKSTESEQGQDTSAFKEEKSGYYGLYREEEPDFNIPWRLSLSWDFSESKAPPYKYRSSGVRGNLEFNLTPKWKFSIGGGYDLVNKEIVVPDIRISRDLHCWIMNFSWVPMGYRRHFMFEIRIKAPQLQDIKVTKTGSPRGIY